VSIVDHRGREIVRSTVEHNAAGLRELLVVLERAGVREVAIARTDRSWTLCSTPVSPSW
jgi:transposase